MFGGVCPMHKGKWMHKEGWGSGGVSGKRANKRGEKERAICI